MQLIGVNVPRLAHRMDDRTAERVAELFSALSDPNRVRIIAALLSGEKNVGEIAEYIAMSSSAVSHQLRMLRQFRWKILVHCVLLHGIKLKQRQLKGRSKRQILDYR